MSVSTWKSIQPSSPRQRDDEIRDVNRIQSIRITLASPEQIRAWSHGEVKNPETIDYKTYKPKTDGLFCERIFGPTRDYECTCGKYKGIKHRGVVCDRCGVEVTQAKVRRSRLGHIELEMPISHIWFSKGVPSRMATFLDLSVKVLERVLYFEEHIVIDPGDTDLMPMQVLTERELSVARDEYGDEFEVGMGAEAIKILLEEFELDELAEDLKRQIRESRSKQKTKKCIKRLKVVEDFRESTNDPGWMILDVLPVIPPDLRPLVPLDGGRFATSDLNDLYRRVINRNNRLRRLKEVRAPEVIIRNEKRMLQEAVDALLDNGRRGRPVKGSNNRPLKSLSDMLKGKQGRFRQNLLGKRVDYSGRSVIVCGADLRFNQCGLPKQMALELFEPFIIRRLEELDEVTTIRSAKRKIERGDPEVFDVLEEVIKNHPILLNRAPTLHRMGMQAFQPILVEGKAIRLHPLACTAFNADFDGDQMAVHVPLSQEAQEECRRLMLAEHNILSPADGNPIATPSQDIVLGCYFLTKVRDRIRDDQPKRFTSTTEALIAHDQGYVDLQEEIEVRVGGLRIRTTPGRIIFNESLPEQLRFVNRTMGKGELKKIISRCYNALGKDITATLLDELKALGYHYAKIGGISISLSDMRIPKEKKGMIDAARKEVADILKQFEQGAITETERYNKVIHTWLYTTDMVAEAMMEDLKLDNQGFNPIYIMADSGARGSKQQIRQLSGMRGLMSKPMKKLTGGIGEIIESPIESNFKEGLTVLEYFISTHGSRKGLADTALKTAEAGYLTRRLVDVAQDVIISEDDCGTLQGMEVSEIREGDQIIESLKDRVIGRVASEDVYHPITGEQIVEMGGVIDEETASMLENSGLPKVRIRSVVSCETRRGVCSKCYGWDLSERALVKMGVAVGVIAAQSIGEPGTQLTLRTFHIGGTAGRVLGESEVMLRLNDDDKGGLREGEYAQVHYVNLKTVKDRNDDTIVVNSGGEPVILSSGIACPSLGRREKATVLYEDVTVLERADGRKIAVGQGGKIHLASSKQKRVFHTFEAIPTGAELLVGEGETVKEEEMIAQWDPMRVPVVARARGKVELKGFVPVTGDDELTRVPDDPEEQPLLVIGDDTRSLLPGHVLTVAEGDKVSVGETVAWLPTPTVAEADGKLRYRDILEGITMRRVLDSETNSLHSVITEAPAGKFPRLAVVDRDEVTLAEYPLPPGSRLRLDDDADVFVGSVLANTAQVIQEFPQLDGGVLLGARILIGEGSTIRRRGDQILHVTDSGEVPTMVLANWDQYYKAEIASEAGTCRYDQIIEGVTMRLQRSQGGSETAQMIIMEHREDKHPAVVVEREDGNTEYHHLPSGAQITVNDTDDVLPGDVLAKIPKETFKSRDVTGGLPRVEELFEARRPKPRDLAIIAKLDGWVRLPKANEIDEELESHLPKKRRRGTRIIMIGDKDGNYLDSYEVEIGKHVIVSDGDWVATGTRLVDGSIDPHEYLEVMGEKATQDYLLNEIQEVYRLQGVSINDKHIEVTIRQMLRKVTITDAGDTTYLQDDDVERHGVLEENENVTQAGGKPAQFKPRLLGITKTSLGTESFISAASFQETTRVLTAAAISGKADNLQGLKENVIMGHLIPAGTGWEARKDAFRGTQEAAPAVAEPKAPEEPALTPAP